MGIYRELKTGVLVIGGGGAALKSALAAMESGADVLVITKGAFGKSGATYYSVAESGGYCCPSGHYDPTDSEQIFYEDILNAAQGAAKPELAKILAEEAVAEKEFLERIGLCFARKPDGGYISNSGCFSSKRRNLTVLNHFKPILKVLGDRLREMGVK